MKISKLFHWLYAFLMLLPIFAIGSVVLVNTFNAEAKNESNIIYKYETNEVSSVSDLKEGNIYTLKITKEDILDLPNSTLNGIITFISPASPSFTGSNENNSVFYKNNDIIYFYLPLVQESNVRTLVIPEDNILYNIDFLLIKSSDTDFILPYIYQNIYKCENIPIEGLTSKNISNVFYDSLEQVKNSSVFSWAMNSFLVTPFTYIVGLFGMPTNSIIVLLLSYWLDIAIIWLVFDLIMYVPQLVHRWIDKGMLE